MTEELVQAIRWFLSNIERFSRLAVRRPLRDYQLAPAQAIVDSVLEQRGDTFAVVMSRQAGKNELSAQLEAYLMNRYQLVRGASLIKAAPTYSPQTIHSRLRLRDCLENPWNHRYLHGESEGLRLNRCRIHFFSAQPGANVVGATANVLLECDEAQDVDPDKWNKDFAPMAASSNATTVFYGTLWTSRTLLAQVMRELRRREREDGRQRVFLVPWEQVAAEVPAYGDYVRREIARLGPDHPIIRTQYKLEEIDEAGRLFTPERIARMRGTHSRQHLPSPQRSSSLGRGAGAEVPPPPSPQHSSSLGRGARGEVSRGGVFAITVDVAGEQEDADGAALRAQNPRRDSTVATIFRVDLSTVADPLVGFPTYYVIDRHWWTGVPHATLYAALVDLVRQWDAAYLVVDATGVGAGLASFLVTKFGRTGSSPAARRRGSTQQEADRARSPAGRVVPFEFTVHAKSELGWEFLGLVDTGRYKDYAGDGRADTAQFWREVEACEFEVLPGPGKVLRWGVPDPAVHDDMLISAALVSVLDGAPWRLEVEGEVISPEENDT